MTDILLAEDDPQIRDWVAYSLERDHHGVRAVADGQEALTAYAERRPDLMILDVMMPKVSGYDVLLKVRETDKTLPVLMLTAKSTESDKVMGLGLGADDYMTKPFGVRELQARVSALLRRSNVSATRILTDENFRFAALRVNGRKRTITLSDGTTAELSESEIGILRFLSAHPDEVIARERILGSVWGETYSGTNRTLDNKIVALRKKLGEASSHIETVYGTGYRYRP